MNVLQDSIVIRNQEVHCCCILLDRSLFCWIGSSPANLQQLMISFPSTTHSSEHASANVLSHDKSGVLHPILSRLVHRFNMPVILAGQPPLTDPEDVFLIERFLIKVLSSLETPQV
ncbi:hypothetical protein RCL1_006001 [Eukaryota sp. TZLM3-RCL]